MSLPRRQSISFSSTSSSSLLSTTASAAAASSFPSSSAAAAAYFQFPTPDLIELTEASLYATAGTTSAPAAPSPSPYAADTAPSPPPSPPPPPATTHYWTSDSTRRLEYAAIDAASRGFKGWVRRNLVPECFGHRHVAFDDDTGSVRRYRLELEDERDEKPASSSCAAASPRRRRTWHFWSPRKTAAV
ncbi:hypothetical protein CDD83_3587 [Cordyceps sp. RAO-2017]|nr:hypothetical protein CDD83_3587 [Cordyceps sp. RAO-2017]